MEKTNMSSSQITIWFTNARVKMRKENKLPLNINGKKPKKNEEDDLEEILNILLSSDDETNNKRIVLAYSCLNNEQIVCCREKEKFFINYKISFRKIFVILWETILMK